MRRVIRLAFALQRFELRLLLAVAIVVLAGALGIAWQTRAVRAEQLACYATAPSAIEGSLGSPCTAQDSALQGLEQAAGFAKVGIIGMPIVLALFLGVPVVAREIEGRTASIAWSLSGSRRRWLAQRAGPTLAIVALASLALGLAGDVLSHAAPWVEGTDPGFEDWWSRGPQVALRATTLFGFGVAAGALVGRQLAAILISAAATLALFMAVYLVMDAWMEAAAEPIPVAPTTVVSGKIYGSGWRDDATGELLGDEEASLAFDEDDLDEDGWPRGYTMVFYMVPSERYGEFVLRESVLFGSAAVVTFAGAAWVVSRRRPA